MRMRLKLSVLAVAILLVASVNYAANRANAAFVSGEASATMQVSNSAPHVGDTIAWTLTITNVDSVTHVFNTRVSVTAQTSIGCVAPELGSVFAKNQFAKVDPGQSVTIQSVLLAPAPDCVPNAAYLIGAVVLDGSNTVAMGVTAPFTVSQ